MSAGAGPMPSVSGLSHDLIGMLQAQRGHFRLESGQHGDLWLDLDRLLLRPDRLRPFAVELAGRLRRHGAEAVCGPMAGGAFLALMIATESGMEFSWADRSPGPPVQYRIPAALRMTLQGRRVAVVDDVINAGSAVRATLAELRACGAIPVAIGALLVLASPASREVERVPLERIAELPSGLWQPGDCPFCAAGTPLQDFR